MRRQESFRAFAIIALLLPGLVFAAPTAGACGLCDRGVPCPNMATPEPIAAAHSCCGDDAADAPVDSGSSSFSSKACDCGRDAAPAVVASVEAPTTKVGNAAVSHEVYLNTAVSVQTAASPVDRPSTTPPPPLLFLLDCVFLT